MSELEKMRQGLWHDANNDSELVNQRNKTAQLCYEVNNLTFDENKRKQKINEIIKDEPEGLNLLVPFYCDYGYNIEFGKNVFVNINCYFMDGGLITIGDNVFIGPNCGFYTVNHPVDYQRRNLGLEKALPITIGANVWLGASVIVLPGVSIGSGSVIGAGSVVTKDIPPNSLALGNPCKVIQEIKENKSC